jgi:hypothetical protein
MKESDIFARYIREVLEGKYVLHGSPKKLSVIEPRQAISRRPEHSQRGVYASSYVNIALLYAVIHIDRTLWGWRADFDKSLKIDIITSVPLSGEEGYIHVLPRAPFKVVDEGFTLLTREPIAPRQVFSVHKDVLKGLQENHLIRIHANLAA